MDDLRALIGQLFMVDFTGYTPAPDVERLIARDGVGGVILFDKNIASPQQIAGLTNGLQEIAASAGRPPLLISADQEGGQVVRLRAGATHFPSAMAFGAAGSEALAASAAGVTARELRAVGIHMNMAPVLDVNNNPANPVIGIRSFGEDPALVARLGVASVRAMQASGVLAAVKHFPGHGDTELDSHLVLPTVSHPLARLDAVELAPFRAAIRAGAGAVITAHVVYPALDPERPATLSPLVIGMLRERLGFSGIVVTDSMAMHAVTGRLPPGEAAVQAVLAGCDVILACGPAEAQEQALRAVRDAVVDGRVPEERVRASAERVLAAKRRLGLLTRATVSVEQVEATVGIPQHLTIAARVAAAAATLVRDPGAVIPLPAAPVAVAGTVPGPSEVPVRLVRALHAAGRDAALVPPDGLRTAGTGSPFAVVLEREAPGTAGEARARVEQIVRAAASRGPTVVVSVDTPYALAGLPPDVACIAVYGADPPSLAAAVRVLTGALSPRGRLPVTLPDR